MNAAFKYRFLVVSCVACWLFAAASLPAQASAEGSFDRTLQVNGPVNIDLSTGSGNIQVRSGNSGQVQITGRIKVTNWFSGDSEARVKQIEANPPIQQSGNDIRIGHIDDPELRRNVSISYDVIVPADTQLRSHSGSGNQTIEGIQGSAEVEAGSGDLKISNIGNTVRADTGSGGIQIDQVKGNVHAKAGSGDIRGTGIAGGFEGRTGSGHIRVEQTAPGSVNVETGSGGIELTGVHGSLGASAGSGNISAEGSPTGSWTVHTGSGTVRLKIASGMAFDLDARSSSGSITVSQPMTVQGTIARKEIHGKVNGGGVSVRVETGSGNVEIE